MNVPPAGLNVGVATSGTIVYVALATLLFAIPLAAASARSVVVCVTAIGPVYTVDAVVGSVARRVGKDCGPRVASAITTWTDGMSVAPAGLNADVATSAS